MYTAHIDTNTHTPAHAAHTHTHTHTHTHKGLGNISLLSSYRNICSVQYQYCQHFATCNNIACAILLQYRHAVVYIRSSYYRIVSTE